MGEIITIQQLNTLRDLVPTMKAVPYFIVQRIGDMGVQFWQEISNCVIRLMSQCPRKSKSGKLQKIDFFFLLSTLKGIGMV